MSNRDDLPPVKPAPQWLVERNERMWAESKPKSIEQVRRQVANHLRERFPDGPLKPETLASLQEDERDKAKAQTKPE